MMKFLVVVRRTEEWDKITREELFKKIRANPPVRNPVLTNLFFDGIERWDKEYNVSFCEYRHILCEIAHDSWHRAGLDWINFTSIRDLPKEKDLILLPSDDDDVFAPFIKSRLEEYFDGVDGIRWLPTRYYATTNKISDVDNGIIGTNSYAIRSIVSNQRQIMAHPFGLDGVFNYKQLQETLSLAIRHPASITFLEQIIKKQGHKDVPEWFRETADYLYNLTQGLKKGKSCGKAM